MIDFSSILSQTKFYNKLEKAIKDGMRNIVIDSASVSHIAFVASLVYKKLNKNIVIIVPDEVSGFKFVSDINKILNQESAILFKARDIVLRNIEANSLEYEHQRLNIIYKLLDKNNIIVTPIDALHQYLISPDKYKNLVLDLKLGQVIKIDDLSNKLISRGYIKRDQVDGVGQFSIRGEIVDIFPPNLDSPVRIDFWDDEIDNIFLFDIISQRKIDNRIDKIFISPTREVLLDDLDNIINKLNILKNKVLNPELKQNIEQDIEKIRNNILIDNIDKYIPVIFEDKSLIIDYLKNPIVFFAGYDNIIKASESVWWHYSEEIKDLLEENILTKDFGSHIFSFEQIENKLKKYIVIYNNIFDNSKNFLKKFEKERNTEFISCYQKEISPWIENINLLKQDLEYYIKNKFKVFVLAGSEISAQNLIKDLNIKNNNIIFSSGSLSFGSEYYLDKIAIITTLSSNEKNKRENKVRKYKKIPGEMAINSLEDIKLGDYVVHINHGIGIFDGINKLEIDGVIKDYIKIKYLGSDTLYVPVTQLDLVSKYIGNKDDKIIKLNKLGSLDWQNRRYKVKKAVKDIAKDLIKLQSERLNSKGFGFSKDTDWQRQFEDNFEYQETDAQIRCIEEIKRDMERPCPMDRLLCGDVGVGKTEVALRASFKSVMDSKQVAILTPTTILSWQHYNTIISRLKDFPIKVEILSRLKTPKQQKEILKKLKSGEIEIIVGTHRLLQKDIEFKDLGLVIIDEEQRFGVSDKEKLKKIKKNVDVLTLSATPIPRTLNMAMSGVKDMSVIDETPQNRFPVQTYVLEYDENIIVLAIKKEIKRNGMVFYLHNRVETIEQAAIKLRTLITGLRVITAHGKMSQSELTKIWAKLLNHEADVLVCTTIIETGIDIPFCNTLIVERADKMGLAQLHQLRGRIGRSDKRAFAYMTFPKERILSESSTKRLSAIKEFTKFGAGFKIAMRDLEIRGAGNILGAEQHGHVDAVGYDMYIKLLSEAVSEEKGESPDFLVSEKCTIDIKTTAYLSEEYISNISERIDMYKKIAMIKTNEDYDDLLDELVDRFGTPSTDVIALLNISLARNLAIKNNIKEISQKQDYIFFYQDPLNLDIINKLSNKYKNNIIINFDSQPSIKIKINNNQSSLSLITEFFSLF